VIRGFLNGETSSRQLKADTRHARRRGPAIVGSSFAYESRGGCMLLAYEVRTT
jgi:hypothetical protein